MAGRGRRTASTSSVSTVNEVDVRHYKESCILKPVNTSTASDNWPCFLLSEATVYHRDGSLVNQLHVDMEGPFIVRGKLEVEKDNERYLVYRNMKSKSIWIQIESSHAFSLGVKDDSLAVPVIWASGAAGWYEIVPSEIYQPICDVMFQGVRLHFSLLDQYDAALEKLWNSKKKNAKNSTYADVKLSINELLFQYALRAGDGLTLPEAYDRLHEQAVFLLSHFPKDTRVFDYLGTMFPDIARKLADRIKKGAKPPDTKPSDTSGPLKAYDYPQREKSVSMDIADGTKRGRGRPRGSVSRNTRSSELPDVEAVTLPKKTHTANPSKSAKVKRSSAGIVPEDSDVIMIDQPDDEAGTSGRSHNQPTGPHGGRSSGRSSTAEGKKPSAYVLLGALEDVRRDTLQKINQGQQKKQLHQISAKSWQTKVYMECNIKNYNSTAEIFLYHARDLVQLLGPEWHDTQIYEWAKDNASSPPTFALISEEEIKQTVRRVKKATRGDQVDKSANKSPQTEVNKYAGKQTPQRNRISGKAAGLRPSTGSKKRLRHEANFEDEMDVDEDGLFKKKFKKSHYFTEEEEEEDDDDDDDDASVEEVGKASLGERKPNADENTIPLTKLVIRAEILPSTQPRGPNKTWTCEEADCGYVVRAAHEEEGQKLINNHFEEHEKEAQDVAQEIALNRANLAMQEGTRGHMPINHLLDKIRNSGDISKRRDGVQLNGHLAPEPIKRKLLV